MTPRRQALRIGSSALIWFSLIGWTQSLLLPFFGDCNFEYYEWFSYIDFSSRYEPVLDIELAVGRDLFQTLDGFGSYHSFVTERSEVLRFGIMYSLSNGFGAFGKDSIILPRLYFYHREKPPGFLGVKWSGYGINMRIPYVDILVLGILLELVHRKFIKRKAHPIGGFEVATPGQV